MSDCFETDDDLEQNPDLGRKFWNLNDSLLSVLDCVRKGFLPGIPQKWPLIQQGRHQGQAQKQQESRPQKSTKNGRDHGQFIQNSSFKTNCRGAKFLSSHSKAIKIILFN